MSVRVIVLQVVECMVVPVPWFEHHTPVPLWGGLEEFLDPWRDLLMNRWSRYQRWFRGSGRAPIWRWVWNAVICRPLVIIGFRSWKNTRWGLKGGSGSFLRGWFNSDVKNTFLKCLEWLMTISDRVGRSFQSNVMNHWGRKLFSHWSLMSSWRTFGCDLVFWWIR